MTLDQTEVDRAILQALSSVGGSASRKQLKNIIATSDDIPFSYSDVYDPVVSKAGNQYVPFDFYFNFGIRELVVTGYVEQVERGQDVNLSEKGRSIGYADFPRPRERKQIDQFWTEKHRLNTAKAKAEGKAHIEEPEGDAVNDDNIDNWRIQLIAQLKQFSPQKFESFARLLISKMGVRIDKNLGIVMSNDQGIDGFGYFESDEFRTSRVAIQAKRYTNNLVSAPEIDKFKGAMNGFNAEYGIFITTTSFTEAAQKKSVQGGNTVTLISGQDIAELVERYQLHITPVNTYRLLF